MGQLCATEERQLDPKEQAANSQINKDLKNDKEKSKSRVKILLLGAGLFDLSFEKKRKVTVFLQESQGRAQSLNR